MQPKIIGIRELHKHLPAITTAVARGKSFVVIKHAKPIFNISPIADKIQKTHTLADFKAIKFSHPNKNLSKEIDAAVYKI